MAEAMVGASAPERNPRLAGMSIDVLELQGCVEMMCSMAEDVFDEIDAVCKLTLQHMETKRGAFDADLTARMFSLIKGKCEHIGSCIRSEAFDVGYKYVDDAQERRWAAQNTARSRPAAGRQAFAPSCTAAAET